VYETFRWKVNIFAFVDYEKAFDKFKRYMFFDVLEDKFVPHFLLKILELIQVTQNSDKW
jgi:hypothetical protein